MSEKTSENKDDLNIINSIWFPKLNLTETYTNKDRTYDLNDIEVFCAKLKEFRDEISDENGNPGRLKKEANLLIENFRTLNSKTRDRAKNDGDITGDKLEFSLTRDLYNWQQLLDGAIAKLDTIINNLKKIDDDPPPSPFYYPPYGNKDKPKEEDPTEEPSIDPSVDEIPIDEIPIDEVSNPNFEIPSFIISLAIGALVIKDVVIIYEELGSLTGVEASLTDEYTVLGIIKADDKYYYKIGDVTNNKIYYVEINDKIEWKTELDKIIEIKEDTMLLSSMEIGTDNFVKTVQKDTFYIVLNEEEKDDMLFYNVLDPESGNAYYIPASDEVSLVSLNDFTNQYSQSVDLNIEQEANS